MTRQPVLRKKRKASFSYVTTCGSGLEDLVAEEVLANGGLNPKITPGAVSWQGNLESGYSMCLWSRFGSRVLMEIASFEAPDPDTLYREASAINWDSHFDNKTTFAVFCTLVQSEITHSRYAALRVKDAIVDQFRVRTRIRPDVDQENPQIRINVHINKTTATLALDLSGESLHRRGYRKSGGQAPLKETLAAAIVKLSGFAPDKDKYPFILDPMCGSATLLIEAAMMHGDIAPGLQRKSFGFVAWNRHNEKLWQNLVEEAISREEEGYKKNWPRFIGYDCDAKVIESARHNIHRAGLDDWIAVEELQLASLSSPSEKGLLLVNPPYGERLSEKMVVKYLYRCLGRKINAEFSGWKIGFFSANPDLADVLRTNWIGKFKLYNGPIKCCLLCGTPKGKTEKDLVSFPWNLEKPGESEIGKDLANRLMKNCRSLFKWAQKSSITCFRIYDGDIPEFNFSVDLYEHWVLVHEYKMPKSIQPDQAEARLATGVQVVKELLNLQSKRVYVQKQQKKTKQKQSRKKAGGKSRLYEIYEQQCCYFLDPGSTDTRGFPLDLRSIRELIKERSGGKSFLNLYGSSGTATVSAAVGGAVTTSTVDPLAENLNRALAHLALNGFSGQAHSVAVADPMEWLLKTKQTFDLIFVNPPVYLPSPKGKDNFDIQKDHETLLQLTLQKLHQQGLLIFSTKDKKFTLSQELIREFSVTEITGSMIPNDFKNSSRVHRSWKFQHAGA